MERSRKSLSISVGGHNTSSSSTPPLNARRSESDISLSACSLLPTTDFGRPLKPSRSNTEYGSAAALKLAALSPCFYHRRFNDSIDVDRILEEIAADDSMSHSKLMQTALSVREVSKQLQRRPIKRAVRTVMIVTKARDNDLVYKTRELAEWLMSTPRYGGELGVTVYVDAKLRKSKRFDSEGLVAMDSRFESMLKYWTPDLCWSRPEKFDLVLTLGGDGTVLFTSWLFQRIVPPILSFSLGSLGFLTPFDFQNFRFHLDRVMGGLLAPSAPGSFSNLRGPSPPSLSLSPSPSDTASDAGMRVNMRMRFTCTVYRAPSKAVRLRNPDAVAEEAGKYEVLNELVIDRGPSPYVSNLELFGDGEPLTVIQADGVIFSTPTGSTAYSLSAGGSLVHPDIPAILLTPICPHTLSFRPMLLNDTVALRVAVPRSSRATAHCSFDGKGRIELRQGDYVTIAASQYPFPTVVGGKMEWIDSVSRTLRWNTREASQKGWGSRGTAEKPQQQRSRTVSGSKDSRRPSDQSAASASAMKVSQAFAGSASLQHVQSLESIPAHDVYDNNDDGNGDGFGNAENSDLEDDEPEEDFDIDFDAEDDDAPLDSRDSGYDGASTASMGGGSGGGTVSPPASRPVAVNI